MKSRIRRLFALSLFALPLFALPLSRKNRSSSRYARLDVAGIPARRQGQALLLAVLIMLLAALLSAGFLAVVSGNLNQSARVADKTRAIEASRAGIAYANAQLSGSAQGDLWRPIDVSPAPNTTDAAYNFYYSQLDRVQGWAAGSRPIRADFADEAAYRVAFKSYRDSTYGKFPDPNQNASDAPKFLVKVEEITRDSPMEADHAGEIKITSIGLSQDDPNVYHRSIAYKAGRLKSPMANALRSVSNWRFGDTEKNSGVPYATLPRIVNAATQFPANNVEFTVDATDKPAFSGANVPFNVVIIKRDAAPAVRGAVVTKVENDGAKLTFARLERTIGAGETIQKAAALGIGATIDLLNTGRPTPYPADLPQSGGIRINGSAWLHGQIRLSDLSANGAGLFTSGSLAIDGNGRKPIAGNSGDIGPTDALDETSNRVVSSSQTNFPGNLVLTAAARSNGVETSDLIDDGWDKAGKSALGLDYSSARDIEPFTPVRMDDAANLARYRALARNSANGIYIDNRGDIERVNGRAMTQAELLEMLMSPATPATSQGTRRLDVAAVPSATNVSLEQRHLRGWVGPDEFLARGALVELIQDAGENPRIQVTLDARSDADPSGPDAGKTFRDLGSGKLQAGVYARAFDWPKNGIILAEGNLRVRGDVNLSNLKAGAEAADFPSLTIVSLGNIYIEGALSVDSKNREGKETLLSQRKKLLLLARKNVIVNPTRAVLARTDAQTLAANPRAVSWRGTVDAPKSFVLAVADVLAFNQGDLAEITGATIPIPIRGLITKVDKDTKQLTISSAATGSIPIATAAAPVVVRSPLEKRAVGIGASDREFFSLVDADNAINRRFVGALTQDNPTNRNRLIFDHSGDLRGTPTDREGLKIRAEDFDATHPRPGGFTAVLANKQPLKPDGNLDLVPTDVRRVDKILRTRQSFAAPALQEFDGFISATKAKPLSQFALEISAVQASREMPAAGYRYVASLTSTALEELPAHALMGIGLRYETGALFVAPNTSPGNQRRENFDIATAPEGFTIPLATSVEYDLNGEIANLLTSSQSRKTKYIGFNPKVADSDDGLTVGISFYQPQADVFKSSLDSRSLEIDAAPDPKFTLFPQSVVLRRSVALSTPATSNLLPDYRVRALKIENASLNDQSIKPVMEAMPINAFVCAQEGSWLVIPGAYFRSSPPVRGIADGTGKIVGSYIDFDNSKTIDANEYILRDPADPNSARIADLNRDGNYDKGEIEAGLRFARYNIAPIQFTGAIIENQSAIVSDVAAVANGAAPIVVGAVQDWTDKWATYSDFGVSNSEPGKPYLFDFISYQHDPSLAQGTAGTDGLRVPVTSELIYQQ